MCTHHQVETAPSSVTAMPILAVVKTVFFAVLLALSVKAAVNCTNNEPLFVTGPSRYPALLANGNQQSIVTVFPSLPSLNEADADITAYGLTDSELMKQELVLQLGEETQKPLSPLSWISLCVFSTLRALGIACVIVYLGNKCV